MNASTDPSKRMSVRTSVNVEGLQHGSVPIPQASVVRDLLVSGGINGKDRATGRFAETAEAQVALVFENIEAVLAEAGGSSEDIVKLQFFVVDEGSKDAINEHWLRLFPDPDSRPARHTLTHALNAPLLVQAEVIAVLGLSLIHI